MGRTSPTLTAKSGDRSKLGNIILTDSWFYDLEINNEQSADVVLESLIDILSPSLDFINDIKGSNELVFRWYIQSELAQLYLLLTPRLLDKLSTLGIALEFSIFSWGGVEK